MMTWTRERALSGPGDTLNGRYEIHHRGTRWIVLDRTRQSGSSNGLVGSTYGYKTMRYARGVAEMLATHDHHS